MGRDGVRGDVQEQLGEYVAGERRGFELPVCAPGSPSLKRVWDLLRQIPYGQTVTYGELARDLGGCVTAQEVGAAVGRNPVCILIPCHRVLGAGGKLTGYAGGLGRKRFLLDLERKAAPRSARLLCSAEAVPQLDLLAGFSADHAVGHR